jgi:Inner membrane component of T3SS, cytoplasmic domain
MLHAVPTPTGPLPTASVDVIAGPDAGRLVALHPGRHVLGRAPRSTLRLEDPAVEAHHAIVTVGADGEPSLIQLSGRRPILVDGVPAMAGEPVAVAASIEIGDSLLVRPVPAMPRPETIRPVPVPPGLGPADLEGVLALAARVRRAADLAAGGVLLGVGTVRLPIGLVDLDGDPIEPSLELQPVLDRHERHDAHPVRAVLGRPEPVVVGLLVQGRDPAMVAARNGVVRSVVAQLSGWTVAAAVDGRTAPAVERLADRPGPVLLIADRAQTTDELLRRARSRAAPTAVLLLLDAASPAVSRCTATLRIGPRWRAQWTPDVSAPTDLLRIHLRGLRAPAADRLAAA